MIDDEQVAHELKALYEREPDVRPDRARVARTALDLVHGIPQDHRRWRLPSLWRTSGRAHPAPDRKDDHTPGQATDRQPPTVIGRTQTMFSPARTVIAAALVFGVGSAFLIARPFDQGERSAPAATTDELAAPVAFTARVSPSGDEAEETCQVLDGISQCRGLVFKLFIVEMSDPRLDGKMTASHDRDTYPGGHWFDSFTYRIQNDDGAWEGSTHTTWFGGDYGSHSVVLTGTGAYQGLYAWVDMSDWTDVSGVIFPAPPPEIPVPPRDESGA